MLEQVFSLIFPVALSWLMSAFRTFVAKLPANIVPAAIMGLGALITAGASALGLPAPFDAFDENILVAGLEGVLSGAAGIGYYELVRRIKGE